MGDRDKLNVRHIKTPKDASKPQLADVIPLNQRLMPEEQPDELSAADATRIIRVLAADTNNIVVIPYGKRKSTKRRIGRRQIELCVQKGTLTEGPFLNAKGNWQMNLFRHAAGEQITCVVVIDWVSRVLVLNTF